MIITAYVRLKLPRENEKSGPARPFNIFASDVNILIESKPEGKVSSRVMIIHSQYTNHPCKDETVVTLNVIDLNVEDTSLTGALIPIICLTMYRSLVCLP
jgi:autophagy-related protein 2